MRILLSAILFLLLTCSACRKSGSDAGDDSDGVTTPPPNETIHSRLIGTSSIGPFSPIANGSFVYGGAGTPILGGSFQVEQYQSFKYNANILLTSPLLIEKEKTLDFTGARTHYARLSSPALQILGEHANYTGSQFSFGNGGQISLPVNAVFQPGTSMYPGYFSPGQKSAILVNHLDPADPDFARNIPAYLRADAYNHRSFLLPYSYVRVVGGTYDAVDDRSQYDIYRDAQGQAEMVYPKLADFGEPLPDSIALWRLLKGKWLAAGYAHRVNNQYQIPLENLTAYLLATPVQGRYWTVRLRTENAAPLINATVRISDGKRSLAEVQTDWEGNAILYIPSGKDLVMDVLSGTLNGDQILKTVNFRSTGARGESIISVPGNQSAIFTVSGKAIDCSGNPIKLGELMLWAKGTSQVRAYLPVIDGKFHASFMDKAGSNIEYHAFLSDLENSRTGDDTLIRLSGGSTLNFASNTCLANPDYFVYSEVDTTKERFEASLFATTPQLTGKYLGAAGTNITVVDQRINRSMQFTILANRVGSFPSISVNNIYLSGTSAYSFASDMPSDAVITQYDSYQGGIIAGTLDFYCRNIYNRLYKVKVAFRVKRIS